MFQTQSQSTQNLLIKQVLDRLVEYSTARLKSQETIRAYEVDIKSFIKHLTTKYNAPVYINELTEEDIEEYLDMLRVERGLAPASINRQLNSIRMVCQLAYKRSWIDNDMSKNVEPLKKKRKEKLFLTTGEIEELLGAIDKPHIQYAVRTMAFTGLRVKECVQLTKANVDLENDVIHVISGKGDKDRNVPIGKTLKPFLVEYSKRFGTNEETDRFFATERTGQLSPQYINRMLHDTTQKLGWKKKVTCHTLRHSFASNLLDRGVNIVKISKILGHADIRTTNVYLHFRKDDLTSAVDLL